MTKYLFPVLCMAPALAWSVVPCPPMPAAITSISHDVKSDINATVGALGKLKAGDVAVKTEVASKYLLDKYPNLDKLLAMQTMSATYCAMLNQSALSDLDKLARWEKFQDKVLSIQDSAPQQGVRSIGGKASTVPPAQSESRSVDSDSSQSRGNTSDNSKKVMPVTLKDGLTESKPLPSSPIANVVWGQADSNGVNFCHVKGKLEDGLGISIGIEESRVTFSVEISGNNWEFTRYLCRPHDTPPGYCEHPKIDSFSVAFGGVAYRSTGLGSDGACDRRTKPDCAPKGFMSTSTNGNAHKIWGKSDWMTLSIGSRVRPGFRKAINLGEPQQALRGVCLPRIVSTVF